MDVRRGLDGWHGSIRGAKWGLTGIFRLSQVPFQLRRNWQPRCERLQAVELFGPLFRGYGEPRPEASSGGNQISADQKDLIPDCAQSPLKPTRREHRLPKAHQEGIEDAAGPKRGIGRVK